MRVAIIGANGQLGTDLVKAFSNHDVMAWTRQDFDICDHGRMAAVIQGTRPDAVVNTAAFHNTDACEEHPELAFEVNAIAVRQLAHVCQSCGAALVQISTDFVFDGEKRQPYTEEDCPRPLNVYGASKAAGERFVATICRSHYIVRVASLFGGVETAGKRSFVEMVLHKAERGEPLVVVDDVVMSPTYTADASRAIRGLVEAVAPHGVYHVTNAGACSWYTFALEILRLGGFKVNIRPTTLAAFAAKTPRPPYSALASNTLRAAGLAPLPPWREALQAYLNTRSLKASA
jgi:dTDP-4-dehydrorhamnose reductase